MFAWDQMLYHIKMFDLLMMVEKVSSSLMN